MLATLAEDLRRSLGILHKQDIQSAAHALQAQPWSATILLGDDCAAIPDGEGFLLLASEGLLPTLVEEDPWFAGWCGVLVNVSDIYAMGGRPTAVVDSLWTRHTTDATPLFAGMTAAALALNVPIVGGHTNRHSPYNALSVAILGRATRLISSFQARPGDALMVVSDLRGQPHPRYPFCWDAATHARGSDLQANLELLPQLAEAGLCDAGKDISMGGILGTLLMLLETSRCGAVLDLHQIPVPAEISLEQWLVSFPSYGFLLSVRPGQVEAVQERFQGRGLACAVVGQIEDSRQLVLRSPDETVVFWDLTNQPLTGWAPPEALP